MFVSFNKNANHCFLGIQLLRGLHSVLIYSACQIPGYECDTEYVITVCAI